MKKSMVSVVLPIYNVEKYLERCLKSIVNQTYKNLEIILVDDGSTDSCSDICEEWAKKDERIKVIHKTNAGLGMARNTGIENAKGEYICFFDSDDYVALDTVEKAYSLAKKTDADIVTFGHTDVKSTGVIGEIVIPHPEKNIYEGNEVQEVFLPDMIGPNASTGRTTNLWMSAWSSIYSMELIRRVDWKFVSERDIISEDIYSILRLYKDVQRVAVLPESFYFYCENVTSLTHTYKKDRYERIKHFYTACIDACNELKYSNCVKERLAYPFISCTIAALKIIEKSCTVTRKTDMDAILNDSMLHDVICAMNLSNEGISRKVFLLSIKYHLYGFSKIMIKLKSR